MWLYRRMGDGGGERDSKKKKGESKARHRCELPAYVRKETK